MISNCKLQQLRQEKQDNLLIGKYVHKLMYTRHTNFNLGSQVKTVCELEMQMCWIQCIFYTRSAGMKYVYGMLSGSEQPLVIGCLCLRHAHAHRRTTVICPHLSPLPPPGGAAAQHSFFSGSKFLILGFMQSPRGMMLHLILVVDSMRSQLCSNKLENPSKTEKN